jgi:hypothetical protein
MTIKEDFIAAFDAMKNAIMSEPDMDKRIEILRNAVVLRMVKDAIDAPEGDGS